METPGRADSRRSELTMVSIEILLRAVVYTSILLKGLRKGGPKELIVQNTMLGWILSGAISISGTLQELQPSV